MTTIFQCNWWWCRIFVAAWAFSSRGERGLPFPAVHRLLTAQLHWLQSTGPGAQAHGLSCPGACGIFPDSGLNPCPLHWQAGSYSLYHQGSPWIVLTESKVVCQLENCENKGVIFFSPSSCSQAPRFLRMSQRSRLQIRNHSFRNRTGNLSFCPGGIGCADRFQTVELCSCWGILSGSLAQL